MRHVRGLAWFELIYSLVVAMRARLQETHTSFNFSASTGIHSIAATWVAINKTDNETVAKMTFILNNSKVMTTFVETKYPLLILWAVHWFENDQHYF